MDPLVLFLRNGSLLKDKIRRKAPRYWLFEEQKLYKHSYSRPYLLCVHLEVIEPLLVELCERIYGSHTERRSLSYRALTKGY